MTGLLSDATINAIADLGAAGVQFDEDVRPALAAVGLDAVRARAGSRATAHSIAYFVPTTRDDIRCSLAALDLADPDVVDRVIRFTSRVAEVFAASPTADRAKMVRLRNALADDGYSLESGVTSNAATANGPHATPYPYLEAEAAGGDMARVSINKREIARMMRDIQREFDKHPIRVDVKTDGPVIRGGVPAGNTTIYNGPVIHGSADGAQLAWGNQTVRQAQNRTEQVAPGFEAIAQAVVSTLKGLSAVGLAEDDQQDAEAAANEVLDEVTQPTPDRGKIRRALVALKGFLAPVASGLVTGSTEGAQEWARTAVEQLGTPF
jgi:hypothetical protein